MAIGNVAGVSGLSMKMLIIGSCLPDIDYHQSFIGKVLSPVSLPIYQKFGHRKFIHSLVLWLPITVIGGWLWAPLFWFGVGTCGHIILDCLNITGVQLLTPLTRKTFVLMNKLYRLATASKTEYVLMTCIWLFAWGAYEVQNIGGFKYAIGYVTGSYNLAIQYYKDAGERICYMNGYLRYPNGTIIKDSFKVIGLEGSSGIAIWDHRQQKILHLPKDAEFLACWLRPTEDSWNRVRIKNRRIIRLKNGPAFQLGKVKGDSNNQWHEIHSGDSATGFVNYELGIVEIAPDSRLDFSAENRFGI